ncbi:hypothetical protein M0802_015333 [Mischocyttarus mexicanus]|nr:hypothetical protein M0802_015333 [Mischocyttarus mexicanus]
MKNAYPVVTAASSSPVDPDSNNKTSNFEDQTAPIIRLKLDKPLHWDWELTTTSDTVPVIQLLDKDGKLLVETTGKTAQRARGSFREGLTSYEEFPNISRSISVTSKLDERSVITGNRNMDGFSNKFGSLELGLKPRKSRSDVGIKLIHDKKVIKCKDNKQVDNKISSNSKRYYTGDFLRRQILDDLRTKSNFGKSPEEIAKERCRKVKDYLRSQSDLLPGTINTENYLENDNNYVSLQSNKTELNEIDDQVELENKSLECKEGTLSSNLKGYSVPSLIDSKEQVDPVKLLRIRSFLSEKLRERMERDDLLPINKRHSDCCYRKDKRDYRTRKVRSETNVTKLSNSFIDTSNVNNFSSKSNDRFIDENLVEENQIQNIEDKVSNSDCGNTVTTTTTTSSSNRKNRNYHRSKSDVLLTGKSHNDIELKKTKTRRECSDRRRTYRKTKSDLFFDNPIESKKDLENIERSWRDYKERKKIEKLQKEQISSKKDLDILTDDIKWRTNFQNEFCCSNNCKICQNLRISMNPMEKQSIKMNCPFQKDPSKDDDTKNNNLQTSTTILSPDFGYNSIPKSVFKDYRQFYARSNVKKSDTFKIIDGSEDGYEDSTLVGEDNPDDNEPECQVVNSGEMISLANKSNEDIARDYFKRVYELLKKRQEEARMIAEKREVHGYDDSSSSNYVEEDCKFANNCLLDV